MSQQLQPGSCLGKYEVVALIAQGGMGDVYKATDLELHRPVALKVLSAKLANNPAALERFHREARHVARLQHPNIVTLYECGHDPVRDAHYLALEYVAGVDLHQHLDKVGMLTPRKTQRVLVQATQALCHACEQGLVHRDIKPGNILLTKVGDKIVVKLTDFGLARRANEDDFRVTREGNTVGTIDYMAPEQARDSAAADIRSDIYSLGCTAYHMLAGQAPFAKGGLGERLVGHLETPPTDVRQFNPRVSLGFWKIVQKMLAKKPEDRYATPHDLLAVLEAVVADHAEADATATVQDLGNASVTTTVLETQTSGAPKPEAPRPPKRRRKPKPLPGPVLPEPQIVVSPQQAKAAEAFHQRALEVIKTGSDDSYARQLLINCLNLDPITTVYRKTLRDMHRKAPASLLGGWFGSINLLGIRSKLRLAKSVANWRKVLEHGEEILASQPDDIDAHLDMAEAARSLGLLTLAVWLLESGCEQSPTNTALMRALAGIHETMHAWKAAVALWERIRRAEPANAEAPRKLNELLAREHVAETLSLRSDLSKLRRKT